jgi:hypothetical protein
MRLCAPTARMVRARPSKIPHSILVPFPYSILGLASHSESRIHDRQYGRRHGRVAGLRQVIEIDINRVCPIVKKRRQIDRICGVDELGIAAALAEDGFIE